MHCKRCNLDRPQWQFAIRYNSPARGEVVWREPYCLICKRVMAKFWRTMNPEKSYQSKRNWNLRHPELCRAQRKRNRISQPKTLAAARRRYRKKHWAREKLRIRESRKRHPDTWRRNKRDWKRRTITELRPLYLRDLLRHRLGKTKKFTTAQIQNQKIQTSLCRTQHLFKSLAAASALKQQT